MPAKEVKRQLGLTYKCAWRIANKIREFMATMDVDPLFGEVEIDESRIGWHRPSKTGRGADSRTIMLGMKQRGTGVKAFVIPDPKATTILPLISEHVDLLSPARIDECWDTCCCRGSVRPPHGQGRLRRVLSQRHSHEIDRESLGSL